MQITLRDYQKEVENGARSSLKAGNRATLIQLPTGGGKTRIFCSMANTAQSRGFRIYILVHRKELLKSTIKSLAELGISAGQIKAGARITTNLVQVAMVDTLRNRIDMLPKPDLILSDEAHRDKGKTREMILNQHWADVPLIGFSATPYRLDGHGLGDVYDYMVEGPQFSWMVNQGWLCFPITFCPEKSVTEKFKIKRGDFDKKEQEGAFSKRVIVGDVIKTYREKAHKQPAIYFCCSVAHAHMMADEFCNAGYKAVCVTGNTEKSVRDKAVNDLAMGEIHIITNVDVFTEGTDIPYCTTIGLLRKTMSLALYLQMVGRGSCPYWNYSEFNPNEATAEERRDYIQQSIKPRFNILDHAGNIFIHGDVLMDRVWTLEGRKKGAKRKQDLDVKYTRCPDCLAYNPGEPRYCINCGNDLREEIHKKNGFKLPEQIEGELVEAGNMNQSEAVQMASYVYQIQQLPPATRQKAAMRKCYELKDPIKIEELRKVLGYKKGWEKWAWERVRGKLSS